jgi:hypothetical protein
MSLQVLSPPKALVTPVVVTVESLYATHLGRSLSCLISYHLFYSGLSIAPMYNKETGGRSNIDTAELIQPYHAIMSR